MIKKCIYYFSVVFCIFINFLLDFNINNYINFINNLFSQNIILTKFLYAFICPIIALISILICLSIKLIVFQENNEIKGIKLKSEDGTFGTANWLSDIELNNILARNDVPGLILGKKDNDIIKLPFDSNFNKNIAVFGSSRKYENNSAF